MANNGAVDPYRVRVVDRQGENFCLCTRYQYFAHVLLDSRLISLKITYSVCENAAEEARVARRSARLGIGTLRHSVVWRDPLKLYRISNSGEDGVRKKLQALATNLDWLGTKRERQKTQKKQCGDHSDS
jgi:hypothetical protein